ncbi:MAG: hypothetical protein IK027_06660 [Deltaproteobacteria bacterium]|nr:hypothetical protein [Deltaproteobacteria bacterium]
MSSSDFRHLQTQRPGGRRFAGEEEEAMGENARGYDLIFKFPCGKVA